MACAADFRNVVLLGLHTGMRSGEIKRLKWISVDFTRRVIVVPTTKNGDPKFCPMSNEVHAMLKRLDDPRKHTPNDRVCFAI